MMRRIVTVGVYLLAGSVLLGTGHVSAGPVSQSTARTYQLDIAAQPIDGALHEFGIQSGLQVFLASEDGKGVETHRLVGTFTAEDALSRMLANTGLRFEYLDSRTIAIRAKNANSSEIRSSVPVSVDGNNANSLRLAQVTPATGTSSSPETQTVPPPKRDSSNSEDNVPEILVKGSKITNVDVKRTQDDEQPYTIFDAKTISQSGAVNVEDFLKSYLSANTSAQSNSQTYSNDHGAASSINLRGLGTNETLILVDGRRSASAAFEGIGIAGQPDINGIPISAIERIEVLPSGASAIYGGAALGGVVNIILKKNYNGGEISYTYDNPTSGHVPITSLDASYGMSLANGKTNIMVAGHYGEVTALTEGDRLDLVQHNINTILQNSPSFFYTASNPYHGSLTNIASATGGNLVLNSGVSLNSPITHIAAGTAPGSDPTAGLVANAGTYDLNPYDGAGPNGLKQTLGSGTRTKSLLLNVHEELTSWLSIFGGASTSSNWSASNINLINSFAFPIAAGAVNNPFQQDILVAVPSSLSPPLTTNSVTQGFTIGMVGRLSDNWNSEFDYTWSRNSQSSNVVQPDFTPLFSGNLGGLNPFVDTIAHPLELAPLLGTESFGSHTSLNDLGLRLSGTLGSLPGGQPTVTIGLEHRREGSGNVLVSVIEPNADHNAYDLFFGQSQLVNSIYVESHIPLVAVRNDVPLVRSLELQLAGRSERYKVSAGTPNAYLAADGSVLPYSPPQGVHSTITYTSTNPTVGIMYKPIDDVALRASYARAFLPPTSMQLLPDPAPQTALVPIVDPATGESYSVQTSIGGNPNLQPQTAKDLDVGIIFEPQEQALRGLRLDVEYYRIKQPNYITHPSPQQIVSNPAYASRVTRDPTTGRITVVDASYINAEEYRTAGWDVALDYRRPTAVGTYTLHVAGTRIQYDERQYTIGGPFVDFTGYPAEGGEAKTKANATLGWEYHQWALGWSTTYFGSYRQAYSAGSPLDLQYFGGLPYPYYTASQGGNAIPAQIYRSGQLQLRRPTIWKPIDPGRRYFGKCSRAGADQKCIQQISTLRCLLSTLLL
jgi:iron complex outermembrane recepter protein